MPPRASIKASAGRGGFITGSGRGDYYLWSGQEPHFSHSYGYSLLATVDTQPQNQGHPRRQRKE